MSELNDVRILLTRERERAETWTETIKARGGSPVLVPLVRSRPVGHTRWSAARDSVAKLAQAKTRVVLGLASAHAVEHWRMFAGQLPEGLAIEKVFVVGDATAEKAREAGLTVEVANTANAVGLAEAIATNSDAQSVVLLPRARGGREEGIEVLKQKGRKVSAFELYETVPVAKPEVPDPAPVAWVVSASPSAARAYAWHRGTLTRLGMIVPNTHHAAIGHTTARAARQIGLSLQAVSEQPTIDAILDVIAAAPPVVVEAPST